MKRLTAREVRDLGVLLEVNRLLLHPRGLALEIAWDPDDPDAVAVLRIQDHRDDPEGVYFDLDPAEWKKVEAFAALVLPGREAALGYVVQPVPSA